MQSMDVFQSQSEEMLKQFAVYRGTSMHPLLQDGDILRLVPYHGATPRRGDVILFSSNGDGHVVHRVLAISNGGVITRGDNNRFTDIGRIKGENIVGRVAEAFSYDRAMIIHGGTKGVFIHYALRFGLYGKMILKPILKRMGVSRTVRRGLHQLFLRAFHRLIINQRPNVAQ